MIESNPLTAINNSLPQELLEKIEMGNNILAEDAPEALFLFAASDYNGIFHDKPTELLLLTIGKTCRVMFLSINNKTDLRLAIKYAKDFRHRSFQLLFILAHGASPAEDDSHIRLGLKEVYGLSDVHFEDFADLDAKAVIFLLCCQTGTTNGLARKISEISKRTVFAPKDSLYIPTVNFTICPEHKQLEMRGFTESYKQHVFKFQPNQLPQLCLQVLKSDQASMTEMNKYLIKTHILKDKNYFYIATTLQRHGDLNNAKIWFTKSAKENHSESCYALGRIFQDEGEYADAEHWFIKGADLGDRDSQYELGVMHYNHGDLINAEVLLDRAANGGVPAIQIRVGVVYQHFNNTAKARIWYLAAARKGSKKAQVKLRSLPEPGLNWKKIGCGIAVIAGISIISLFGLAGLKSKQRRFLKRSCSKSGQFAIDQSRKSRSLKHKRQIHMRRQFALKTDLVHFLGPKGSRYLTALRH